MNPACEQCQGACCETLHLPLPPGITPQQRKYLKMRGEVTRLSPRLEAIRVDNVCPMLSEEGRCTIWAIRPQPCKDYVVGSEACLRAMEARRSPEEVALILAKMDHANGVADS